MQQELKQMREAKAKLLAAQQMGDDVDDETKAFVKKLAAQQEQQFCKIFHRYFSHEYHVDILFLLGEHNVVQEDGEEKEWSDDDDDVIEQDDSFNPTEILGDVD
jgi:hypothetical protein